MTAGTEPTAAAPRWVDLEGADNTRDLGGLPVTGGGHTRYGRLLRSGTLQDLTPADVQLLTTTLGVRTVVDLRMAEEAEREGSALHGLDGIRYLLLPLWSADRVRSDTVVDNTMDAVGHYAAFLSGSGEAICAAVRAFLEPDGLPAVFHCAAGKDRTGVLAAVVLDAIGVTSEALAADYALSAERLEAIKARLAARATYKVMRAARGRAVLTASADNMDRLLAHLRQDYGGGAGFLRAHGLTDDELAALRSSLVDTD